MKKVEKRRRAVAQLRNPLIAKLLSRDGWGTLSACGPDFIRSTGRRLADAMERSRELHTRLIHV